MTSATFRIRLGLFLALVCPLAVIIAFGAAQGNGSGPPSTPEAKLLQADPMLRAKLTTDTFKKLKEKAKKATIGGKTYYFVEGDRKVDEDQLLFYAKALEEQFAKFKLAEAGHSFSAPGGSGLISHVVNGQIMRWSPGSTLTYCVLKKTLGGDYDIVVKNMAAAAQAWASVCNIKFKHMQDKDNEDPAASPPAGVTFTVRKINDPNGPIASAFFPGDPATDRHVLLFPDYFTTGFDKVGVLRHELGHVLGFRHEHILSEAPAVCQGEGIFEAIPLTKYDPQSVMHYFCGGAGSLELKISVFDRQGAQMIYGAPLAGMSGSGLKLPIDENADSSKKKFNNIEP